MDQKEELYIKSGYYLKKIELLTELIKNLTNKVVWLEENRFPGAAIFGIDAKPNSNWEENKDTSLEISRTKLEILEKEIELEYSKSYYAHYKKRVEEYEVAFARETALVNENFEELVSAIMLTREHPKYRNNNKIYSHFTDLIKKADEHKTQEEKNNIYRYLATQAKEILGIK